ncbi:hypothetical protein B0H11DRAFT_2332812 [Mycena galericulata]|nr:hypothetical protein B0H11DRAFT_2332812 [Mycena galericulata]
MIRSITGYGAGNGPFISIHDGFLNVAAWAGFLPGSDRIILDTHPYFAFDQQPNDAPIATSTDPATRAAPGLRRRAMRGGLRLTLGVPKKHEQVDLLYY